MRQKQPKWAQTLLLMRVGSPIGWLLLLWPTLIALWLSSEAKVQPQLVVVFTLGVFIMRSAGCVINDWADRKWDGLVARTKNRPLVTGEVSPNAALMLFGGLLLLAFLLVCTTNRMTMQLSIGGALLAVFYPFTKRITYYPQLVLGLAFGWAIPMAYAAQSQHLPVDCWLLYLATICWAVVYDTLYAMVDKEDDLRCGIKSIAIAFGRYHKIAIGVFQLAVLAIFTSIGQQLALNLPYYVGIAIAAILFIYQQWLIKNSAPEKYFQAFLNNQWVGLALFVGTLLGSKQAFMV